MELTIQYRQGKRLITVDCSYNTRAEMVNDLMSMSTKLKEFKVLKTKGL